MEWAAGQLVSQDWPSDNELLHGKAKLRLETLAKTLQTDKRSSEADKLRAALQRLNRRDLQIKLTWEYGSEPAEVELQVKEPSGTVCSLEQKQTPGGGTLLPPSLTEKKLSAVYTAAEAFAGSYEITVRRSWGQPLGGRAYLTIIQHDGTPQKTMRMEVVKLDQPTTLKVALKEGRRTELAVVPPPTAPRRAQQIDEIKAGRTALSKLRELANPDFSGAVGPRGAVGTPALAISDDRALPRRPQPQTTVQQGAITGSGVGLATQLRISADQRDVSLALQPVFQTAGRGRPAVNLSFIPGGGN
jgi:hypothetical protein